MRALAIIFILLNIALVGIQTGYMHLKWDAYDAWYPFFSLIGQGLRAGYFPDFVPHLFSGYSIGGDSQIGLYNPIYFLCSFLFPNSVLSINAVYLLMTTWSGYLSYLIARQIKFGHEAAMYFALSIVACGAMTGNAQHFSYIMVYLSFLLVLYGLLQIFCYEKSSGSISIFFGAWFVATAGYPTLSISTFIVSFITLVVLVLFYPQRFFKKISLTTLSVLVALGVSYPALLHYFASIQLTERSFGLPMEVVKAGSLPWSAFLSFLIPIKNLKVGIDVSMVQVNLLIGSVFFIFMFIKDFSKIKLLQNPRNHKLFRISLVFLLVFIILSLGSNFYPPIRIWMAEYVAAFRLGRFICSEYKFFALIIVATYSCIYLDHYFKTSEDAKRKRNLYYLLLFDFVFVMAFKRPLILAKNKVSLKNNIQMSYSGETQKIFDLPRHCDSKLVNTHQPSDSLRVLYSDNHSSSGYAAAYVSQYSKDFSKISWAVCSAGKLFSPPDKRRLQYQLYRHEPGYIEFEFEHDPLNNQQIYLWSEVRDDFWHMSVNGERVEFLPGIGRLRYFKPKQKSDLYRVKMIYLGPLSRYFRNL